MEGGGEGGEGEGEGGEGEGGEGRGLREEGGEGPTMSDLSPGRMLSSSSVAMMPLPRASTRSQIIYSQQPVEARTLLLKNSMEVHVMPSAVYSSCSCLSVSSMNSCCSFSLQ